MCLIVIAHRAHEHYALVLAANRDERYDRPSSAAGWWPERPEVLAGKDLVAGGSWLAVSRAGRLAAVTNIAEPGRPAAARSRGLVVRDFVVDPDAARLALARDAEDYGPFNALLLADGALDYVSNRHASTRLAPGIHSLSNAPLGADWPKLGRAERGMAAALASADPCGDLLELLSERVTGPAVPETYRQSLFIAGPTYGTRASTVVLVDYDGRVSFHERRFDRDARPIGENRFEFRMAPAAFVDEGRSALS